MGQFLCKQAHPGKSVGKLKKREETGHCCGSRLCHSLRSLPSGETRTTDTHCGTGRIRDHQRHARHSPTEFEAHTSPGVSFMKRGASFNRWFYICRQLINA